MLSSWWMVSVPVMGLLVSSRVRLTLYGESDVTYRLSVSVRALPGVLRSLTLIQGSVIPGAAGAAASSVRPPALARTDAYLRRTIKNQNPKHSTFIYLPLLTSTYLSLNNPFTTNDLLCYKPNLMNTFATWRLPRDGTR